MSGVIELSRSKPAIAARRDVAMSLAELDREVSIDTLTKLARVPVPVCYRLEESPKQIKWAITFAREALEELPTLDWLETTWEQIDVALATHTEAGIKKHIGLMLGAFPNGKPADPDTYVRCLIYDLIDLNLPDAIVAIAGQEIRRTKTFLPTVAEFLEVANRQMRRWQRMLDAIDQIGDARFRLNTSVVHNEKTLAEVERIRA